MVFDRLGSLDVPSPGLGTLRIDPDRIAENVRTAIEIGYRHIDTAEMYGNEEAVGAGIAAADVPREEIFLATKVLHPRSAESDEPEAVVSDAHDCLDRLGVDTVDLLYVHWPDDFDLENAFEAFTRLYDQGVFEHCGVCNFTPELLDGTLDLASPPIEVLQVEMHPLLQQEELREYCDDHDLAMVAYCPVVRGKAGDVPELREIGEKHGVSPYKVSLTWVMEKGAVPIPKATGEAHLRDNWEVQDLNLDEEDVAAIDAIDREDRQADPPFAVW